jgi:hypothetical protein
MRFGGHHRVATLAAGQQQQTIAPTSAGTRRNRSDDMSSVNKSKAAAEDKSFGNAYTDALPAYHALAGAAAPATLKARSPPPNSAAVAGVNSKLKTKTLTAAAVTSTKTKSLTPPPPATRVASNSSAKNATTSNKKRTPLEQQMFIDAGGSQIFATVKQAYSSNGLAALPASDLDYFLVHYPASRMSVNDTPRLKKDKVAAAEAVLAKEKQQL